MLSVLALITALLPLTLTAPLQKRALSESDQNVLELALYLEHLELSLYTGGCDNFTDAQYSAQGFAPGYRENVCVIAGHEQVHADTIATILSSNGVAPIPACTYQFPTSVDPKSFVFLANMITSVGIGAYLGGSENLTDSAVLEEAAASILTVEARHDAFLRIGLGASPFPTNFDTGLSAVWAYNLAQMFIVSCPKQLPLIILPKLNLTSPMPPVSLQPPTPAGTMLDFAWDPSTFFVQTSGPLYIAIINQNISAPIFQEVTSVAPGSGSVPVPSGVAGAAFGVLTTFSGGLTENDLTSFGTLAGPVEILLS
ncbi:hypothetical protein MMC12_002518 [Toensbergia leucococca]|nr:hypothetical protein [Toensbergia leucococca]